MGEHSNFEILWIEPWTSQVPLVLVCGSRPSKTGSNWVYCVYLKLKNIKRPLVCFECEAPDESVIPAIWLQEKYPQKGLFFVPDFGSKILLSMMVHPGTKIQQENRGTWSFSQAFWIPWNCEFLGRETFEFTLFCHMTLPFCWFDIWSYWAEVIWHHFCFLHTLQQFASRGQCFLGRCQWWEIIERGEGGRAVAHTSHVWFGELVTSVLPRQVQAFHQTQRAQATCGNFHNHTYAFSFRTWIADNSSR